MRKLHAALFLQAPPGADLTTVVEALFPAIGIAAFKERRATKTRDRHYAAKVTDVEIAMAVKKEAKLSRYQFTIRVTAVGDVMSHAHHLAEVIANHGWPCFVPEPGWFLEPWEGEGTQYDAPPALPESSTRGA